MLYKLGEFMCAVDVFIILLEMVCSMDGFRVVKLEDVLHTLDILITATGQYYYAGLLVSGVGLGCCHGCQTVKF